VGAFPIAFLSHPETIMRRLSLLLALLPLLAPPAARAQGTGTMELAGSVDRYVQPLLDLDVFSGVVLIARGDLVVLARAYGLADREFEIPIAVDTAFRIASISKSFTRVLVGRLVDRGVLGLDDPLFRWLPEFPSADRITIRLLLDHRAGVPSVNSLPFDEEAFASHSLAGLVDSIARMPLDFEPGTDERYSNGGYAVLALALERATGSSYPALLEAEVLTPLGLEHTAHERDGDVVPRLARGYEPSPEAFGRVRHAPFQEMTTKTGGGSLVSTAEELHQWARALGRDPILRPATWDELFPDEDIDLSGRSPGYNAYMRREGEWIAVVLANNYAAGAVGNVAEALIRLALGQAAEPLPVVAPVAVSARDLEPYTGPYALPDGVLPLPPGTRVVITPAGDDLVATLAGTPVDVLVPQGERTFLLRALWSTATFDSPVDGQSPGFEVRALYRDASFRVERVEGARP
jgi:CubicO group peptidase (beta-lactamase class C family)